MFTKYNEECRKILVAAREEMICLKQQYIGTEHFLLAVLNNKNLSVTKKLNKYNIYYDNYKFELIKLLGIGNKKCNYCVFTPLFKHIIEESEILTKNLNEDYVSLEHILCVLFEECEGVAVRILIEMGIDIEKLSKDFSIRRMKKISKKKYLIEEFGFNMNQKAKEGNVDPVIGREKEIERVIEILCRRRKNNPLLIGDAGVGKTSIVEELSKRIVDGKVPKLLKNKKIISVSMAKLISGTKYRGEFEERITKMLNEVETTDDIILFIDEIHTMVGAGGAEGAIDASNILKPFLARGKLKLIGATTVEEFKKYLEPEKALERRFQIVLIKEPDSDCVVEILKKLRPIYEQFHNVSIDDSVLKNIVQLSNKYLYNRKQPDKSIDILDEACAKTSLRKNKFNLELEKLNEELNNVIYNKNQSVINHNFNYAFELKKRELELNTQINLCLYKKQTKPKKKRVTLKTVAIVIKNKTNIPIYEVLDEDIEKLNKIDKILEEKVVGQEKTIKRLCDDIRRLKLGYKTSNKPKSYIFVGPTGVGKTLLAKELANLISGKNNFIRLDMSEFREPHSISKIIGSPPGYVGFSEKNTILDEVKMKPNAVILLDEIEKSNSAVLNLFLQILDEGFAKTSSNDIVRFDNNIIIMTSNLGCTKDSLGFNNNSENNVLSKLGEFLGVELLNRIDSVFVFEPLDENSILKIIKNKIKDICNMLNVDKHKKYLLEKDLKDIINAADYYKYGARKLEKLISNKIVDKIVKEKINKNVNITIEAK